MSFLYIILFKRNEAGELPAAHYDVGVKRYFAPDDDTQHAHYHIILF